MCTNLKSAARKVLLGAALSGAIALLIPTTGCDLSADAQAASVKAAAGNRSLTIARPVCQGATWYPASWNQ